MRLWFLLGEAAGGLRRNLAMVVSVVLVSAVSLLLLGAGLLAQRQIDVAKGYWYDKVQVSVFLCTAQSSDVPACAGGAVSTAQRAAVLRDLQALRPLVEQVHHETQAQAYQRFREQFRGSPNLSLVGPTSLPESYRVRLADPGRAGEVVAAVQGSPGVEAVTDQRRVLAGFFRVLRIVSAAAVVLAAVMVLCAVLLIGTTVRQTARNRRREVRIMRAVGASRTVIQLPFLVETMTAVLLGAVTAVGVLWALVRFGLARATGEAGGGLVSLIDEQDVLAVAPWLVGGGLLVAALTSWRAVHRHLAP